MATYVFLPPEELTPAQKSAMNRKRWQANRVAELRDGFTWRKSGRDGCLYLKRGDHVLEIYYEISGDTEFDILLYWSSATWILQKEEPMTTQQRDEIAPKLEKWLKENNTRAHWE